MPVNFAFLFKDYTNIKCFCNIMLVSGIYLPLQG